MEALEHMVIVIYGGLSIVAVTLLGLGLITIGLSMYHERRKK